MPKRINYSFPRLLHLAISFSNVYILNYYGTLFLEYLNNSEVLTPAAKSFKIGSPYYPLLFSCYFSTFLFNTFGIICSPSYLLKEKDFLL